MNLKIKPVKYLSDVLNKNRNYYIKEKKLEKCKINILKNLNCPLKENATQLVFGKGNFDAKVFLIGEAPGKDEDLQGFPFVGRSGKELDKLLHSINLSLNKVYIANILKYRPPKNRNPNSNEIKNHTPYLVEQIKIIKPKIICTLGNFSTKFILNNFEIENINKIEGISKIHGNCYDIKIKSMKIKVIPLYHPAAMLYNPKLRSILEADFQKINKVVNFKKSYERVNR